MLRPVSGAVAAPPTAPWVLSHAVHTSVPVLPTACAWGSLLANWPLASELLPLRTQSRGHLGILISLSQNR